MESVYSSIKSNSTLIEEDLNISNTVQKLRRLKIEENVLSKCVGKTSEDFDYEIAEDSDTSHLELKVLSNKLRATYIEIRDLFEEIKANTISEDLVEELNRCVFGCVLLLCLLIVVGLFHLFDIEVVKNDVKNIENKIELFKRSLQTELKKNKISEEELLTKMDENSNDIEKRRKSKKIRPVSLKEIVPSPVKALIYSPMKCPEIQRFQEFICTSKGRYGGWIPYNHNIFEKLWQQFFCASVKIEGLEYQDMNMENCESFRSFLKEVLKKIPGITEENVVAHNKWYTQYIFLKERQQSALEKWKSNKKKMIKSRSNKPFKIGQNCTKSERLCRLEQDNYNEVIQKGLVSDELENINKIFIQELNCELPFKSQEDGASEKTEEKIEVIKISEKINLCLPSKSDLSYRNATEQWINRCLGDKEFYITNMDVANVYKRRIPDWRLLMQNN